MVKLNRILSCILCVLFLAGCSAAPAMQQTTAAQQENFPYLFVDSTGAEVTVTKKPQKIAVLLSSLADVWVSAGGNVDITVGETVERGFAADTAILVDDGAGKTINAELLIASKPDLVLYSSELSGQIECAEMLKAAGIPAAGFCVDTFEEYLSLLKISTDLLGTPEYYEKNGTQVAQKVEELISFANSQEEKPQILFARAGSSAKYTKAKTAKNNFVCIMLDELGTENIADQAPVLLEGLSTEEILLADPDVILYSTMGDEENGAAYMQSVVSDPVWSTLSAVKEKRVYQLPKELFQYKPNARWAEAYAYLIELLYGEIK